MAQRLRNTVSFTGSLNLVSCLRVCPLVSAKTLSSPFLSDCLLWHLFFLEVLPDFLTLPRALTQWDGNYLSHSEDDWHIVGTTLVVVLSNLGPTLEREISKGISHFLPIILYTYVQNPRKFDPNGTFVTFVKCRLVEKGEKIPAWHKVQCRWTWIESVASVGCKLSFHITPSSGMMESIH